MPLYNPIARRLISIADLPLTLRINDIPSQCEFCYSGVDPTVDGWSRAFRGIGSSTALTYNAASVAPTFGRPGYFTCGGTKDGAVRFNGTGSAYYTADASLYRISTQDCVYHLIGKTPAASGSNAGVASKMDATYTGWALAMMASSGNYVLRYNTYVEASATATDSAAIAPDTWFDAWLFHCHDTNYAQWYVAIGSGAMAASGTPTVCYGSSIDHADAPTRFGNAYGIADGGGEIALIARWSHFSWLSSHLNASIATDQHARLTASRAYELRSEDHIVARTLSLRPSDNEIGLSLDLCNDGTVTGTNPMGICAHSDHNAAAGPPVLEVRNIQAAGARFFLDGAACMAQNGALALDCGHIIPGAEERSQWLKLDSEAYGALLINNDTDAPAILIRGMDSSNADILHAIKTGSPDVYVAKWRRNAGIEFPVNNLVYQDTFASSPSTSSPNDLTIGCGFVAKTPCTITGVKFRTARTTNPHTIRVKLWFGGAAQVIGSGSATYMDVSCTGAGQYTCTFDVPYSVSAANLYKLVTVSTREITATIGISYVNQAQPWGANAIDLLPGAVTLPLGCPCHYNSGDADPTSVHASLAWAIDPLITLI